MKVTKELKVKLLQSKEYQPYILFRVNDPAIYIDFKNLPKECYLPINGDYVEGWLFSRKLQEYSNQNIIKIEE